MKASPTRSAMSCPESSTLAGSRSARIRQLGSGPGPRGVSMFAAIVDLRRDMDILRDRIYLDHARLAPTTAVRDDAGHRRDGRGLAEIRAEILASARQHAAALLNARPDEIALTAGPVEGLELIADAVAWQTGDNVLVPDSEIFAHVRPWLALEARGVEVRPIPTRDGEIELEVVASLIDDRTRLLALGHVDHTSGFRADLEAVGALCRRRGVRFVVDATRSMGALNIDVDRAHIDALACGGGNWLLGPTGAGLLFVSADFAASLRPAVAGDGVPTALGLERGGARLSAVRGLAIALGRLRRIGIERIEHRVCRLAGHLRRGLSDLGFEVACEVGDDPARLSAIVSMRVPGVSSDQVVAFLAARGIVASSWRGHVRFSPHFYNTVDEVRTLLAVLARLDGVDVDERPEPMRDRRPAGRPLPPMTGPCARGSNPGAAPPLEPASVPSRPR